MAATGTIAVCAHNKVNRGLIHCCTSSEDDPIYCAELIFWSFFSLGSEEKSNPTRAVSSGIGGANKLMVRYSTSCGDAGQTWRNFKTTTTTTKNARWLRVSCILPTKRGRRKIHKNKRKRLLNTYYATIHILLHFEVPGIIAPTTVNFILRLQPQAEMIAKTCARVFSNGDWSKLQ